MNIYKRFVMSAGFFAALTAGTVLIGAIDGASAKDSARVGSDMTRAGETGMTANRIRNTIHPIIYDPGHDHKRVPAPMKPVKSAPAAGAPGRMPSPVKLPPAADAPGSMPSPVMLPPAAGAPGAAPIKPAPITVLEY
jgi:hypothetical protein